MRFPKLLILAVALAATVFGGALISTGNVQAASTSNYAGPYHITRQPWCSQRITVFSPGVAAYNRTVGRDISSVTFQHVLFRKTASGYVFDQATKVSPAQLVADDVYREDLLPGWEDFILAQGTVYRTAIHIWWNTNGLLGHVYQWEGPDCKTNTWNFTW